MAAIQLPKIRTYISGDGVVDFDKSTQFTLLEKLESVYLLKAADGDLSIDTSKINSLVSMLFYSINSFTIKLTVDIGTVETPNIVIVPVETTGNFRLDPTTAFLSKISAVSISTTSTTDITIQVNVYGGTVS